MKTVCFTGRRPKDLFDEEHKGARYKKESYEDLVNFLTDELEKFYDKGVREYISGGAQGFDQLAFYAVDNLKKRHSDVKNVVYVPFKGQESIWANYGLFGKSQYRSMLRMADECNIITEGELTNTTNDKGQSISCIKQDDETTIGIGKALHMRNHAMVDNSDAIVALFPSDDVDNDIYRNSGTAGTMKYARSVNKDIYRLDYDSVDDKIVPNELTHMFQAQVQVEQQAQENDDRIFISGSRAIQSIPDNVKEKIDEYIEAGATFYVGDAPGVDEMVQRYLNNKDCENVVVYHSGRNIRKMVNKDWEDKEISVKAGVSGREFYTAKDIAMTDDCTSGIVIWDGESKGSKANIDRLKSQKKLDYVYNAKSVERSNDMTVDINSKQNNHEGLE